MSTETVLAEVNTQTGRDWRLVAQLEGGHQSGAHRIEDGQAHAVLKWWDRPSWAPRVIGAAPLVQRARALGYPTPEWLAFGTTEAGFPYQVQEFVEGEHFSGIDGPGAELLLELVARQRMITLDTSVDWTAYCRALACADGDGRFGPLTAMGGSVEQAMMDAARLARPFRDAVVVDHEMVHGDLSATNILMREGRIVAVVDIEAIGRGFAGFDLLTPVRQAYVFGGDRSIADALTEAALQIYGPAAIALGVAAQVMNIIDFGVAHRNSHLRETAIACSAWVAAVRSAL